MREIPSRNFESERVRVSMTNEPSIMYPMPPIWIITKIIASPTQE